MRVLAVSDAVAEILYSEGVREHCAGVELVLSCGDLPFDYLEYIVTMLNVPLVYVLGNHDRIRHRPDGSVEKGPLGGRNADGRVVRVPGKDGRTLRVAGLEGSMFYGGTRHQYKEGEMRGKVLRLAAKLLLAGKPLDVLLTHAAPLGIHDGKDPCHRGFAAFHPVIRWFRPRFLLHGHVHPSYGYDVRPRVLGETTVLSVYGYEILEI
jgi:Icc-related predicted phosphoesterase